MNKRSEKLGQSVRANLSTAKKSRRNIILACVLLITLSVIAFAVAVAATSTNPSSNQTTSHTGTTSSHLTTQLQIRVEYAGSWEGAYADSSSDTPDSINWSGNGTKTITIDRPNNDKPVWVLTVTAQKTAVSSESPNDTLTISILKMDGTILKTANTSAVNNHVEATIVIDD